MAEEGVREDSEEERASEGSKDLSVRMVVAGVRPSMEVGGEVRGGGRGREVGDVTPLPSEGDWRGERREAFPTPLRGMERAEAEESEDGVRGFWTERER